MAPSRQTLKIFATQLKQDPNKLSLLLDLPPELRNVIYEIVLADTETLLSRNPTKRNLASTSALPRVNKQIRDEFMSAQWLLADIHTTSLDFSFRHIVTFLNRLSEAELKALPSINLPSQRKITVELIIDPNINGEPEYLGRWVRRAGDPTRKGTNINYEYVLSAASRPVGTWVHVIPGHYSMRKWRLRKWLLSTPDGREKEELQKIVDAII